jgi:ankyrin repeat protein
MPGTLRRAPRVVFAVIASALGASFGCTSQGWYDSMTGNRTCPAAPAAIARWSTVMHRSSPGDHADLEPFLTRHPGMVNKPFGAWCFTPLHSAAMLGRDDIAKLLLLHGADLHAQDKSRQTPLHTAAQYGRTNVMKILLAAGADANARTPTEEPPLYRAAGGLGGADDIETRLQATAVLLAAGANVNTKGPDARTVLLGSLGNFSYDNWRMIEFLVEHGADVHARDLQGTSALEYAVGTGNAKVITLLLDRGAGRLPAGNDEAALGGALSSSAYMGHVDVAQILIARGADVNWRYGGPLPLEWQALPLAGALTVARSPDKATMARRREVARILLAHGADANARELKREPGETLLHAVSADGDVDALDLLISHGAAVGARDHRGFTPLHRAAQQGRVDIAARLIAAGANTYAAAADGTTALDLAAGDGEMEMLLRHHAKK